MVRNCSWPAVSQICSFCPPPVQIHGLDLEIDAIVVMGVEGEGVVRVAQQREVLPTALSPIISA